MPSLLFKISGRLYAGFGLLVLFGIGLATFAVLQLWTIQGHVGVMDRQSVNNARAIEISSELHAFRRAILRYAFDQDEPSFNESDKRLETVSGLLELAIKQTVAEDRRATYGAVLKDITELKARRA